MSLRIQRLIYTIREQCELCEMKSKTSKWIIFILFVALVLSLLYAVSNFWHSSENFPGLRGFDPNYKICEHPSGQDWDLHIIVITCNRSTSLLRLLNSLNNAVYLEDNVLLEVWVDRSKIGSSVDAETIKSAKEFVFLHGTYRILLHEVHAGIAGQWIYTWMPGNSSKEIAVILEDDLTVSPFFYQYLKLVHKQYDNKNNINGFSLQGYSIRHSDAGAELNISTKNIVFLYPTLGSWGFSPNRQNWFNFVDWFTDAIKDKDFKPKVPGNIASTWYNTLRNQGKGDSIWTIWHIYYAWKHHELTLYCNFPGHRGLTFNWKEKGLHYQGTPFSKSNADFDHLVQEWNINYELLPDDPIVVGNDGKIQGRR